jgi:hypothetical protein
VDDEAFQRMVERQYELLRKERSKDCSDDDKSRPSDDSGQQQQPTQAEPVVTSADDSQPPTEVIFVLYLVPNRLAKQIVEHCHIVQSGCGFYCSSMYYIEITLAYLSVRDKFKGSVE